METLKIAITGAGGLIGVAAGEYLRAGGNRVTGLRRGSGSDRTWNPDTGEVDARDCDAVIHLAGESIAGLWTPRKKLHIRDSRIAPTKKLCRALAQMPEPPRVLLCASAVGFYGHRGDEILTEGSAAGDGFLAALARDWEAATQPASEAGIRVVHLRFGLVLSTRGGALPTMLRAFRLGLGGVLGSGRQWWSWVALDDVTRIIEHALHCEELRGAVNVVAPQAVTNREFTRILNAALHRPNFFATPAPLLRFALGEMAEALLLSSARVMPQKLETNGFVFQQPQLAGAFHSLLT